MVVFLVLEHGTRRMSEDVRKDEEGRRFMRVLGRNMAWLIQLRGGGVSIGHHCAGDGEGKEEDEFHKVLIVDFYGRDRGKAAPPFPVFASFVSGDCDSRWIS